MSLWKNIVARWGSGAGEIDDVRIDASTNSLQTVSYEHHEIHSNTHYFVEDFTTLGSAATIDFCVTVADNAAVPHIVLAFESTGTLQLDIYEGVAFNTDGTLVVQRANNRNKSYSGSHTAVTSATVMTDSTASFTVDALIGWKIYNITDGSYGTITDNDATTVTVASLTGGTDNDWDTNDQYEINQSTMILTTDATVTDTGIRLGGLSGGSSTSPNRGIPGGSKRENELVLRRNTKYLFRFTSGVASNIFEYNAEWYEHEDKN